MKDQDPPDSFRISLGETRYVPAPAAQPKAGRLKRLGDGIAAARSVILNGLFIFLLAAAVVFTVIELRRNVVVIDTIRLPKPLQDLGYSDQVAAYRLWDAVVRINEGASTSKERVALLPTSHRVDFEAPGAGVSLQSLIRMMRGFLSLEETRVAGEFICATPQCEPDGLALRLRVFRGDGMQIISLPRIGDETVSTEIDAYFHEAALELLRALDPYVVASFLHETDPRAAEEEARTLISPSHPQRKWALNLLGLIANDAGQHDDAIGWYQRAVAADEEDSFAGAHNNWGNALRAKGDLDGAIAQYRRAIELDPGHANVHNNWGIVLDDKGDLDGAIAQYRRATELDPGHASAYYNWGIALYNKGDLDGAIAQYRRATELDPGLAEPHFGMALALERQGRNGDAADAYQRYLDLMPDAENAASLRAWIERLRADAQGD